MMTCGCFDGLHWGEEGETFITGARHCVDVLSRTREVGFGEARAPVGRGATAGAACNGEELGHMVNVVKICAVATGSTSAHFPGVEVVNGVSDVKVSTLRP